MSQSWRKPATMSQHGRVRRQTWMNSLQTNKRSWHAWTERRVEYFLMALFLILSPSLDTSRIAKFPTISPLLRSPLPAILLCILTKLLGKTLVTMWRTKKAGEIREGGEGQERCSHNLSWSISTTSLDWQAWHHRPTSVLRLPSMPWSRPAQHSHIPDFPSRMICGGLQHEAVCKKRTAVQTYRSALNNWTSWAIQTKLHRGQYDKKKKLQKGEAATCWTHQKVLNTVCCTYKREKASMSLQLATLSSPIRLVKTKQWDISHLYISKA